VNAGTSPRRDLVGAINSAGRTGTAGPRQRRLRNGLVVAEVALSVILLLGAGLLMRTFVSLVGVDLGFDIRGLLVENVSFPPGRTASAAATQQFYAAALDRIQSMPGVQSAAVSTSTPPFGGMRSALHIPGIQLPEQSSAVVYLCSQDYARTMGLRLKAGRGLSASDVVSARKVAVINETLAGRYFAGQPPVGRTIRLPRIAALPGGATDPAFEVIGVVQDVLNQGVMDPPSPQAYLPFTVRDMPSLLLIVRTSGEPMASVGPIRQELRRIDGSVAFSVPTTLEDELRRTFLARPRFNAVVLGSFAVTGLVLVALGIYGVVAYTVSQQTRQIAIRMALGGERRHVLRMVLQSGLTPVAIGLIVGVAAGALTNRLLETVLWRVTAFDVATIASTIALVVGIGVCACCVPAWRAMRVEPVVALRHE
jgi:putative ABC transport system permease protein